MANASGASQRRPRVPKELGDFTTTRRVVPIAALAVLIGVFASLVALALLSMIGLFTNLFFFQRWSLELASPRLPTTSSVAWWCSCPWWAR